MWVSKNAEFYADSESVEKAEKIFCEKIINEKVTGSNSA